MKPSSSNAPLQIIVAIFGAVAFVDASAAESAEAVITDTWKAGVAGNNRDYAGMIAKLQSIIDGSNGSDAALTAQFVIGRLQINRAEAEALDSFADAEATFTALQKASPKSWQGQLAAIALIEISNQNANHEAVAANAPAVLAQTNWKLLEETPPPHLAELQRAVSMRPHQLSDGVKAALVGSLLKLNKPREAEKWAAQISDEGLRQELLHK